MKEYLVCEVADCYGVSLMHARRFTEEEKLGYVKEYRDRGFVRLSEYPTIELEDINWMDVRNALNERDSDGSFRGCGNSAYIVTEEEWDELVALNEKKHNEKAAKKRAEDIEFYEKVVKACEKQEKLYTEDEAAAKEKAWNNIHNEGGEGFVPHFYTIDEYEYAKNKLEELKK